MNTNSANGKEKDSIISTIDRDHQTSEIPKGVYDDELEKYKNPVKKFARFLKKDRERYNCLLDMEWTTNNSAEDINDKELFGFQSKKVVYQIAYCIFNDSFTDVLFKNYYISNSIKEGNSKGYYKKTIKELNQEGQDIKIVLKELSKDIWNCERIIGQQLAQDVEILRANLLKNELYEELRVVDKIEQYCMMKEPKELMDLKNKNGRLKNPSKIEVYKYFSRKDMPEANNHNAIWDVKHELIGYLLYQEYLKQQQALTDEQIDTIMNKVDEKFKQVTKF
jgi:hypothetical protein